MGIALANLNVEGNTNANFLVTKIELPGTTLQPNVIFFNSNMSLSERLQSINEQILALTQERDTILRALNPVEDTIKKFMEKLLTDMKSAFGSAHPDSAFAERLTAGLTSEPSVTIGMHEGKHYDPVWHHTKIAYDWGGNKR